ncbi:hypothetical protein [Wenzhouxiangella limi]|uniref:ART-PolyVal-like domain-containing protein n=1 Tax=Wenzhouxiangella limi TaxID=2707351 RepID=A0A845V028_9GAMM|nr:hypothetical protein [Wenzhouxiangella limi]NDY96967.1 hypothetical protein [Wenzhouxiangella limi]
MISITAYHGTKADFVDFEDNHPSASGLAAAGSGIYFWEDIRLAEPFAGEDGRVIKAEITLRNPAVMDPEETPGQEASAAEAAEFTRRMVEAGHDGLIVEHPFSGREIVVFDLTAIRVVDPGFSLAERSVARKN